MSRRVIILDLDGVQVFKDIQLHISSCSQLLQEQGFPVSPEQYYHTFMKYYLPYSLGKYNSDSQFYKLVFGEIGVQFEFGLAKELHQLYYQSFGRYPQVPAILTKLHQRYPLFLLSNLVNHWVDFILKKFGLNGIYTYQIVSQSAGVRKPDPEIYQKAMELSAASPGDCILFDDKEENVRGAARVGIEARRVDPSKGLTLADVRDLIEK